MKLDINSTDRAVSPVVGVALLIAITVILAAVIGAVVLGLGTSSVEAPQASLSFEETGNDELIIYHNGGDALQDEHIVIRGEPANDDSLGQDLAAGETAEIDLDGTEGQVSVVWLDPDSSDETVVGSTNVG